MRFDFFAERNLTVEEIKDITNSINMIIAENQIVTVEEMSYEQAIQTGAKSFFEDKYPEIVRVVRIGSEYQSSRVSEQEGVLSVELCGGTHVTETGQIGSFFITEQTSVAAGIKRITALTGPRVSSHLQEVQDHLDQIAHRVDVPAKQLDAKLEKIMSEINDTKILIANIAEEYVHELIEKNFSF